MAKKPTLILLSTALAEDSSCLGAPGRHLGADFVAERRLLLVANRVSGAEAVMMGQLNQDQGQLEHFPITRACIQRAFFKSALNLENAISRLRSGEYGGR